MNHVESTKTGYGWSRRFTGGDERQKRSTADTKVMVQASPWTTHSPPPQIRPHFITDLSISRPNPRLWQHNQSLLNSSLHVIFSGRLPLQSITAENWIKQRIVIVTSGWMNSFQWHHYRWIQSFQDKFVLGKENCCCTDHQKWSPRHCPNCIE